MKIGNILIELLPITFVNDFMIIRLCHLFFSLILNINSFNPILKGANLLFLRPLWLGKQGESIGRSGTHTDNHLKLCAFF
jgi:hypothetical protein